MWHTISHLIHKVNAGKSPRDEPRSHSDARDRSATKMRKSNKNDRPVFRGQTPMDSRFSFQSFSLSPLSFCPHPCPSVSSVVKLVPYAEDRNYSPRISRITRIPNSAIHAGQPQSWRQLVKSREKRSDGSRFSFQGFSFQLFASSVPIRVIRG